MGIQSGRGQKAMIINMLIEVMVCHFTKSSSGNIFGAPITNAIYNNQNIINMERDKNLNYIKPVYSNGVNGGDVYQVTNKRINIWEKRK
jgi:hypothetical protein